MDIDNDHLIKIVSKSSKMVIISTGTAKMKEIIQAAQIFKNNNKKNVIFLHCIFYI